MINEKTRISRIKRLVEGIPLKHRKLAHLVCDVAHYQSIVASREKCSICNEKGGAVNKLIHKRHNRFCSGWSTGDNNYKKVDGNFIKLKPGDRCKEGYIRERRKLIPGYMCHKCYRLLEQELGIGSVDKDYAP